MFYHKLITQNTVAAALNVFDDEQLENLLNIPHLNLTMVF